MRAGPLSNSKVISLLNDYFVPVYVVNEDYAKRGPAPREEKAERDRIFREGHEAKLSVGTVHVYVLRPDGRLLDSMHVAKASRPTNLIAMLEKAVSTIGVKASAPLVKPVPQARKPACDQDALALHLVSRSLDGRGAWSQFPVENWIVLTRDDQTKLVPKVQAGESWEVDPSVAEKILTHFYPATENNDVSKNRFAERKLIATVLGVENGKTQLRLDGKMKMHHSFYHKEDGKVVEADVVGFAEYHPAESQVTSLRMVTEKATYGGGKFAVAVRSMP